MDSKIKQHGPVRFPEFTGDRQYMVKFTPDEGVPDCLAPWKDTISDMLDSIILRGNTKLFVTVDQAFVKAGDTHRRAGAHIDGNWGFYPINSGSHSGCWNCGPEYELRHEAILLANSVDSSACAYIGYVCGSPGEGGDCQHLSLNTLEKRYLKSNTCYEGNVECIHECLPVSEDCYRQMIRIVIPGQTYPIPTTNMSKTATTNSSHALPTPHPFLEQVKTPMQKLLARKAEDSQLEQKTAKGIELALNSLEDIPGVPGKLHFKILVTEEGYQVHTALEKRIITL